MGTGLPGSPAENRHFSLSCTTYHSPCRFPNFGPVPEDAPLGQATDAVMRRIASRRAFKDGLDFLLDLAGAAVRPTILVFADEWLHRALLCSVHVANSIWPARRNRKKKFLFSKNRRQRRGLKPQLSDLI